MERFCTLLVIILLFYAELKLSKNNITGKKIHIIAIVILIAGLISSFYWSKLILEYDCHISKITYKRIGCDEKSLSYLGILNFIFPLLISIYFWRIGNVIKINKIKEKKKIKPVEINNLFNFKTKKFFGKVLVFVAIFLIIYRFIFSCVMVDEGIFVDFIIYGYAPAEMVGFLIIPIIGLFFAKIGTLLKNNQDIKE